jgi:hypothetical protein
LLVNFNEKNNEKSKDILQNVKCNHGDQGIWKNKLGKEQTI